MKEFYKILTFFGILGIVFVIIGIGFVNVIFFYIGFGLYFFGIGLFYFLTERQPKEEETLNDVME